MKACCAEWAKMCSEACEPFGGGFLYPTPPPTQQFKKQDDGTWSIYGCCGGGCYVVTGMKYCPFCGASVSGANTMANASTGGTGAADCAPREIGTIDNQYGGLNVKAEGG